MPSDAINTLQLKITNDASDAIKQIDKLIKKVEKLESALKGIGNSNATSAIREIASSAIATRSGGSRSSAPRKSAEEIEEERWKKRARELAIEEQKIAVKFEQEQKRANQLKLKEAMQATHEYRLGEAPSRMSDLQSMSRTDLLHQRYDQLRTSLFDAVLGNDPKKATDIALQMKSIEEQIARAKQKTLDIADKEAKAEQKAKEEAQKKADAIAKSNEIASQFGTRLSFYSGASSLDLLYQKQYNAQSSLRSAILSGDDEKATSIAERLLRINNEILKEKQKIADAERQANEEASNTASTEEQKAKATRNTATAMREVAKAAESAKKSSGFFGKLMKSIGRIAFYRLIRSAMKNLTQSFKEGAENLYHWSEAFNTNFAPTMDTFKTQMTYLKNGFASMFSPLIEWVVPNVIVPLTDALVEMFNLIQQFFAAMVGHDYWYKAQKSMDKYAESTKKANIQLAKFDELNNLTENGNDNEKDYGSMFTLEKVANEFSGLFTDDWFLKGWNVGNLAANLGSNIIEAIANIDVDSIITAIGDFFDGLMTGFFDSLTADNYYLAKKIGLNLAKIALKAVKVAVWGMTKFSKIGIIADFLGYIATGEWGVVSDTIDSIVNIPIDDLTKDVDAALAELEANHGASLAGMEGQNADAVEEMRNQIKHSGIPEAYQEVAEKALANYKGGVDWGDSTPETLIKQTLAKAGIPHNYLSEARTALDSYLTGVDWKRGGRASATDIENALIAVGIPATTAKEASYALAAWANNSFYKTGYTTGLLLTGGWNDAIKQEAIKSLAFTGNVNLSVNLLEAHTKMRLEDYLYNLWNKYFPSTDLGGNIHGGGGSFGSNSNSRNPGAARARGGWMTFASGGMFSQGTMYVAGEVPGQAEMVGNINGRTGVASGFEITGIRDAVIASGENEAQLLTRLITTLERKNLVIAPSAQLGRVMAQSNRLYGAVTG